MENLEKSLRQSLLSSYSLYELNKLQVKSMLVIDAWLEDSSEALEHWNVFKTKPEHEAFGDLACEILALWQGLKRFDPTPQIEEMIQKLGSIIEPSFAECAFYTLEPEKWLETVETKEFLSDEELQDLFDDIDHAELIVSALVELKEQKLSDELEKKLEPCVMWFCQNPEEFVEISHYIEAFCFALREDLEEICSGELIATLYKLSPLMEEIESVKIDEYESQHEPRD